MTFRSITREPTEVPAPRTFGAYVRSFGPGFVAVLTWLGAGDIVTAAVAGGNYGYSLTWALVLALAVRWFFVDAIARYQLCNPHGRGVVSGLAALHRAYPPFLLIAALLSGHLMNAYMFVGIGEVTRALVGVGPNWLGAICAAALLLALVLRPRYARIERVFKLFLALLSVSLLGCAIAVGPDVAAIARGLITLSLPRQTGGFDALLVVVGMIGAVGGALTNLTYPYFLEQKGWRRPEHRKLQSYDFLLAVLVVIALDLAVWTLGAELVHAAGGRIDDLDGLTGLLSEILGPAGRVLFELGLLSAIFTSLLGVALGFGYLVADAHRCWRRPGAPEGERDLSIYRGAVLWLVLSPLAWALLGDVDFVGLTLLVSAVVVPLIPALAGGLWRLTASAGHIGAEHRNRWWENALMAAIFALALWGSVEALRSTLSVWHGR